MNDLINNPVFQSALLPLVVAFVAGWLLRPLGWLWAGLGFAIAYAASVFVTAGFQFFPLTSTRKIFLLGAAAVLIGLLLDWSKLSRRYVPWLLAALGVAATVWVIWPLLKRQEGLAFWIMLSATSFYVAWVIVWFEALQNKSMRASTAAVALGVGTGIIAVLGASALLGQLGSAIGAAAGAFVLLLLFFNRVSLGSSFTLPVATLSALIGIAAVVYAGLTWYALIPIAIIPLAARIPVKEHWNKYIKAIVMSSYTLVFSVVAIAITWQIAQTAEQSLY